MDEMLAGVFSVWLMDEVDHRICEPDERFLNEWRTAHILHRKLEWAGIKIIFPKQLLLVLDVCSKGNPGIIQLIAHRLLLSMKIKGPNEYKAGKIITTMDFLRAFNEFPSMYNAQVESEYMREWDMQKDEKGGNRVDTLEWWADVKTN